MVFTDTTTAAGTQTSVIVADPSRYAIDDEIEYDGDGVVRKSVPDPLLEPCDRKRVGLEENTLMNDAGGERIGRVLIPNIDFIEPLKQECAHFVDCLSTGQRPLTDGENGLKVVRVLEAASRSLSGDGVSVTLPQG